MFMLLIYIPYCVRYIVALSIRERLLTVQEVVSSTAQTG